jgi:hypothetical protein
MRVSVFTAVLALIPVSGCFTMRLWDSPRGAAADRVLAAGLEDSHRLVVEIAYKSGGSRVFTYQLRDFPPPDTLRSAYLGSHLALAAKTEVELPVATTEKPEHELRFAPGASLHLSVMPPYTLVVSTRDLALEPGVPHEINREVELVTIPDQGVDWSEPVNWGRAFLTLPAAALDILTSPFQIGWYVYMLCTGQVCG